MISGDLIDRDVRTKGAAERRAFDSRPEVDSLAAALRDAGEGSSRITAGNGLIFLQGRQESRLSYVELWRRSVHVAEGLRARGVGQGDRIMLMMPVSESYVALVCGAMLLGAIPCTVASPGIGQSRAQIFRLLAHALAAVSPALLIVTPDVHGMLSDGSESELYLAPDRIATASELDDGGQPRLSLTDLPKIDPHQPAHIQLTSGSTRPPRGAVLSHHNVISNVQAIARAIDLVPSEGPILSWLPCYHDMGYVQLFLALYYQATIVLMPSSAFLRNPMSWFQAISHYHVSHSSGPTFAFSLSVQRFDAQKMVGVDLSNWRRAIVSAEPIPLAVLQRFYATFAPFGLREDALCPCYGMAEVVVGASVPIPEVTANRSFGLVSVDRIDADALRGEGRAVPAGDSSRRILEVVGVGRALAGLEFAVRNIDGTELPERMVGEICVRGSSMMLGYFENPVATAEVVRDGWYYTGDRGYLVDGELYVLGRIRDLIIVRGRNFDPQDVESAVEECMSVRLDSCVAFGRFNVDTGTDDVIVIIESKADGAERDIVRDEVQAALQQGFGFIARDIVLVRHGALPRTTSHKKQRALTAAWYAEGRFDS